MYLLQILGNTLWDSWMMMDPDDKEASICSGSQR